MTETASEPQQQQQQRIVKFGKYKGQPISKLLQDDKYVRWIRVQQWFDEKNTWVRRAVRSRPPQSQEASDKSSAPETSSGKRKKQKTLDSFFVPPK